MNGKTKPKYIPVMSSSVVNVPFTRNFSFDKDRFWRFGVTRGYDPPFIAAFGRLLSNKEKGVDLDDEMMGN